MYEQVEPCTWNKRLWRNKASPEHIRGLNFPTKYIYDFSFYEKRPQICRLWERKLSVCNNAALSRQCDILSKLGDSLCMISTAAKNCTAKAFFFSIICDNKHTVLLENVRIGQYDLTIAFLSLDLNLNAAQSMRTLDLPSKFFVTHLLSHLKRQTKMCNEEVSIFLSIPTLFLHM